MKTQELNPVSSPAVAWLEKLESSGFLTPASQLAVAHQTPVGTASTSSHYFPCGSPRMGSADEESPRLTASTTWPLCVEATISHLFPAIPDFSHVFPDIFLVINKSTHSATITCPL